MALQPHPEHWIAHRIAELEQRAAAAGIQVQHPGKSLGGAWEAQGDGWAIVHGDPSKFADDLEGRLPAKSRPAGADGR